jgi:hypothetical protein
VGAHQYTYVILRPHVNIVWKLLISHYAPSLITWTIFRRVTICCHQRVHLFGSAESLSITSQSMPIHRGGLEAATLPSENTTWLFSGCLSCAWSRMISSCSNGVSPPARMHTLSLQLVLRSCSSAVSAIRGAHLIRCSPTSRLNTIGPGSGKRVARCCIHMIVCMAGGMTWACSVKTAHAGTVSRTTLRCVNASSALHRQSGGQGAKLTTQMMPTSAMVHCMA